MNEIITNYLNKNSVFTLATTDKKQPFCAICFYVFNPTTNSLLFFSSEDTQHIKNGLANENVAVSICSQNVTIARLQGVQLRGVLSQSKDSENKVLYLKKFPMARVVKGECWEIEITYLKMTNNVLGFGKKIIWEKGK